MMEKINNWIDSIRATDFSYLGEKPYLIIAAIAAGLFILLVLYRIRPRRRIRAFKGETGYVEISRHALLELVHSACEQMPEVRKPSIKVKPRRKLNLSVRIRVDGSVQLRDTAAFLQTHLKDALENNLGVEKLGRIEVLVTGIRSGSRPKSDRGGVDLNAPKKESTVKAPAPVPESPSTAPAKSAAEEKKIDPSPAPKQPETPISSSAGKPGKEFGAPKPTDPEPKDKAGDSKKGASSLFDKKNK